MAEEDGQRPALLAPLTAKPKRAGIFVDFDGTLSPIVPSPEQAQPLPGVVDALDELASRYAVVAVVSGRSLASLTERLPVGPSIRLFGLYGLQRMRNGRIVDDASSTRWRSAIDEGATTAQADLPRGVFVERKGMSFVLHYRGASEYSRVVEEWAAQYAAKSGLDAQRGRMSVEIGPFSEADKGAVVKELAQGLSSACVIGDDVGDCPAFDALDHLAATAKLHAVKVGVRSPETPPGLLDKANIEVDGPEGVLELLRSL